ncbi:MAG: hypothetical protein F6K21_26765 [Symploca sp. SIO2D2]|nr:hypothetical protein [Symploca sp. SIO2D2]
METILHIGMQKTGSTTLQKFMHAHSSDLLNASVLYPEIFDGHINHNILAFSVYDQSRLPREFAAFSKKSPEKFELKKRLAMDAVEASVAKAKPKRLVISAEYLSGIHYAGFPSVDRLKGLRNWLSKMSDSIKVLMYVRRPSDWYLSHLQQTVKGSSKFPPFDAFQIRETIENYTQVFGEVVVRKFDRESLIDGDIRTDFLGSQLKDVNLSHLNLNREHVRNQSLSAESIRLLMSYRAKVMPEKDDLLTPETHYIVTSLEAVERKASIALSKPCLPKNVKFHINHSNRELEWLKENHGVEFEGIDYQAIDEGMVSPTEESVSLGEDSAKLDELRYRLIEELSKNGYPVFKPLRAKVKTLLGEIWDSLRR